MSVNMYIYHIFIYHIQSHGSYGIWVLKNVLVVYCSKAFGISCAGGIGDLLLGSKVIPGMFSTYGK